MTASRSNATKAVKIWDIPTRLFHWALVASLAFMWWSAEEGGLWMDWHVKVGVFVLALLLFRLIWGFVGSETARFSHFLRAPQAAWQHLRALGSQQSAYHAGHNPLGAWMVVALLCLVGAQATTGLFATDDILVEGPLYDYVSSAFADRMTGLHHQLFNGLLAFIAVHVLAVFYYLVRKHTNLIKPMVSGRADWPEQQAEKQPNLHFVSAWWALAIFLGCYGGLMGLLNP